MENEEEHPQGAELENPQQGEPLPPPDYNREPEKKVETDVFSCPMCNTIIPADATSCPGCGALFSGEEEMPEETDVQPQQTEEEDMQEPAPQELPQEQYGTEGMHEPETQYIPPIPGPENEETQGPQKIPSAMANYEARRKKRYLTGALFLGLGLVLFVLLWLVVVNQVLVEETDKVFGFEVILLLVGAGILFILGLFLVLTYPSSSLSEIVSLEPSNPQPAGYTPGSGFQPPTPPDYGIQ